MNNLEKPTSQTDRQRKHIERFLRDANDESGWGQAHKSFGELIEEIEKERVAGNIDSLEMGELLATQFFGDDDPREPTSRKRYGDFQEFLRSPSLDTAVGILDMDDIGKTCTEKMTDFVALVRRVMKQGA